jgi:hypothetical protein
LERRRRICFVDMERGRGGSRRELKGRKMQIGGLQRGINSLPTGPNPNFTSFLKYIG